MFVALSKKHIGAVQTAVTIDFDKLPPLLERQPPVITRGCLYFLSGNTLVRRFGRRSDVV